MTESSRPAPTSPASGAVLDDALLGRIRSRAAAHDAANTFPFDDVAELAAAGYLRALVPTRFGGLGLTLPQLAAEQSRLAAHAPATALAVNMHLVWTGVAKAMHDRGDTALEFVLTEAAQGAIFGFGVSEPGNDLVLFGSSTDAAPQQGGGYRFTGTKIFTSLSPVWTQLGTMGLDSSDPARPLIVWAFLDRADPGITRKDDWDTLGMRGSQSQTTLLDGASAPADRVVRTLPPGPVNDPLIFGIFATFEILLSSVYTGIAQRALELGVAAAKRRRSAKNDGRALAQDPDVRRRIAEAALLLDALYPQIQTLARDVDTLVDHGPFWFARLAGLKHRSVESAKEVVDLMLRVNGGASYFTGDELGRLYRDVLAGLFHPSTADSAHATVATAWLGPLDD
ncbi:MULTISPECIES: acyl-CoA dehydrogenase family protein [Cryobacterium]|uniref:acyl-CoA dehydrogenase family protein n=1 Tax=Cryobacterium TaxID=69578 RepID=UPI000CD3BD00|nr:MULTISPECIES: acyl-CoA dehydrogenase family protein [Cryobacterium]POH69833.1 acyl-CoA dehydrogenase [Cryobacterium zongtaii]TFC42851.1 acyl-CoA dehydrogenase [Cryobacterium sp. TMN-39-2]